LALNKFLSEKTMNSGELDETCIWLDLPDPKISDLIFFDLLKLIPFLGILKIFF